MGCGGAKMAQASGAERSAGDLVKAVESSPEDRGVDGKSIRRQMSGVTPKMSDAKRQGSPDNAPHSSPERAAPFQKASSLDSSPGKATAAKPDLKRSASQPLEAWTNPYKLVEGKQSPPVTLSASGSPAVSSSSKAGIDLSPSDTRYKEAQQADGKSWGMANSLPLTSPPQVVFAAPKAKAKPRTTDDLESFGEEESQHKPLKPVLKRRQSDSNLGSKTASAAMVEFAAPKAKAKPRTTDDLESFGQDDSKPGPAKPTLQRRRSGSDIGGAGDFAGAKPTLQRRRSDSNLMSAAGLESVAPAFRPEPLDDNQLGKRRSYESLVASRPSLKASNTAVAAVADELSTNGTLGRRRSLGNIIASTSIFDHQNVVPKERPRRMSAGDAHSLARSRPKDKPDKSQVLRSIQQGGMLL